VSDTLSSSFEKTRHQIHKYNVGAALPDTTCDHENSGPKHEKVHLHPKEAPLRPRGALLGICQTDQPNELNTGWFLFLPMRVGLCEGHGTPAPPKGEADSLGDCGIHSYHTWVDRDRILLSGCDATVERTNSSVGKGL
jgi:hypothetical protein